MANFCSRCGENLTAGAQFCPRCGTPVPADTAPPQMRTPQDTGRTTPVRPANNGMPAPSLPVRSGGAKSGLLVFLCLIMVVELVVGAFWRPGFLRSGGSGGGHDGGSGTITASGTGDGGDGSGWAADTQGTDGEPGGVIPSLSEGYGIAGEDLDPETGEQIAPGNPRWIGVDITEEDLRSAVPVTVPVSPENTVVQADGITVDFGDFNLTEEDTLEVRSLGEKHDDISGDRLVIYDFALASGRHTFPTEVTLTIPRTAGDRSGRVLYFNDEAKMWEPIAFEESEDGRFYHVYMDHFTGVTEDVDEQSEKKLGAIHAVKQDKTGNTYPMLQQPMEFNDLDVARMYGFDSGIIRKILNNGGIAAEASFSNLFTTCCNVEGGLDALNTTLNSSDEVTGNVFGAVGLGLTFGQLYYQLTHNPEILPVLWNARWDILGAAATIAGFFVTAAPISAELAIAGVACYLIANVEEYVEEAPGSTEEAAYREYLNTGIKGKKGQELKLDGTGWAEELRAVIDEHRNEPDKIELYVQAAYDNYLEKYWTLSLEERQKHSDKVKTSFLLNQEPGTSNTLIIPSLEEMEDLEKGGKRPDYFPVLNEVDLEKRGEMIDNARDMLYDKTKLILLKLSRTYIHNSETEFRKEMNDVIIPRLNRVLLFYAEDTGLLQGQSAWDSPYLNSPEYPLAMEAFSDAYPFSFRPEIKTAYNSSLLPMMFVQMKPVRFWPWNMRIDDYAPHAYIPHLTKRSDGKAGALFICTMYHYLQIGSPKGMLFRGDGTDDHPQVTALIKIPEKPRTYAEIKMVIERPSEKGGEEETYKLQLSSDQMTSLYPGEHGDPQPTEISTITIYPDNTFELRGAGYMLGEWKSTEKTNNGGDWYKKVSRSAFTCKGKLLIDTGGTRKGIVTELSDLTSSSHSTDTALAAFADNPEWAYSYESTYQLICHPSLAQTDEQIQEWMTKVKSKSGASYLYSDIVLTFNSEGKLKEVYFCPVGFTSISSNSTFGSKDPVETPTAYRSISFYVVE